MLCETHLKLLACFFKNDELQAQDITGNKLMFQTFLQDDDFSDLYFRFLGDLMTSIEKIFLVFRGVHTGVLCSFDNFLLCRRISLSLVEGSFKFPNDKPA